MQMFSMSVQNAREATEHELSSRLHFDDRRVFDRLHLARVPGDFVEECLAGLMEDDWTVAAKGRLEYIAFASRDKPEYEPLGEEEIVGGRGTAEWEMYDALMTVFRYIEHFSTRDQDAESEAPRRCTHSFRVTERLDMQSDGTIYGLPEVTPDFLLLDLSGSAPGDPSDSHPVTWHNQSAFCQIKTSDRQGPIYLNPPEDENDAVKQIVSQAAEYARLHLSARPFQLFSVALLIFGTHFCVAMFDREGVVFSPIHHMWRDTALFIRVVRALTHHLSAEDLGRDPTVSLLSVDEQAAHLEALGAVLGSLIHRPAEYPTYRLRCASSCGGRVLYTIGKPLWMSVSSFGRGTSVWLVVDILTYEVFVFKNSWRKNKRISESDIYAKVTGRHDALADFESGGDVFFPGSDERRITVRNLRQPPLGHVQDMLGPEDTVLHRLLLRSYGRPIIEWTTIKELLTAIRDAISAHQFLFNQGILHRDISPGNVMLSSTLPGQPPPTTAGFLMDVELAHVKGMNLNIETRRPAPSDEPSVIPPAKFGQTVLRGGIMTGTANFMSTEAVTTIEHWIVDKVDFVHEPHHDLESFIYVLAYGLFGGLYLAGPKAELLEIPEENLRRAKRYFYQAFFRMAMIDIHINLKAHLPLEPAYHFEQYLPGALKELLFDLDNRIQLQQNRRDRQVLTYEYLLTRLEKAIAAL